MKRDIGVGVCLLVAKEKKLLVAERIGDTGKGYLAVPGGVQEKGEPWERTAVRELSEEAGHAIKVIIRPASWPQIRSESNLPLFVTNNVLANGGHWITVWLRAEWQAGEPVNAESDKKKEWVWMTLDEITDDPRMRAGRVAWVSGEFDDALHWLPLPELHKFRDKLGL